MLVTGAEKVLLHLLPLWNAREPVRGATQEGIAEGTGLLRSHVPRALKRLIADGHAEEREGRLKGRGRKVRLYSLTESGIRRAKELLAGLQAEEIRIGDRTVTVAALASEFGVPPVEIVADLDDRGRYVPRTAALAVPETDLLERDADLRALLEWARGTGPAAVVTGSKGVGKTSLGRAFARSVKRPVVWVDVSPEDPGSVPADLARSLAVLGGKGTPDAIREDLAALRPVVVIDGYGEVAEGVVDAVRDLLATVAASPGPKLLVLAQEATPSYCRFYGAADVRKGTVREVRLKGLSPDATKRLLGNPGIEEEALRQIYLLTKGAPLYLVLIRDGDAPKLRQVSRFTSAEIRLMMFSSRATR